MQKELKTEVGEVRAQLAEWNEEKSELKTKLAEVQAELADVKTQLTRVKCINLAMHLMAKRSKPACFS